MEIGDAGVPPDLSGAPPPHDAAVLHPAAAPAGLSPEDPPRPGPSHLSGLSPEIDAATLHELTAVQPARAEEDARIAQLLGEDWSIKAIAKDIGRSHDFVTRRVRHLEASNEAGRPTSGGWPIPDTTPAEALQGRSFEDVCPAILDRECRPGRLPINGDALAAAARARETTFSRSAADRCVEA